MLIRIAVLFVILLNGSVLLAEPVSLEIQAIVKTKASATPGNSGEHQTTFFPAEVVVIKERTATSAFAQVEGVGIEPLKGPAWIPLETLALQDSFQPITTWSGVKLASVCMGSCDGTITLDIDGDGSFHAKAYEGSDSVGTASGRLFKNGNLIWARVMDTQGDFGNLKGRMNEHLSFRLMNDDGMCFIEHDNEAKDGCICVSVGEVKHIYSCDEDGGQ